MRLHVGAKSLQGDIAAYAKRFNVLEVHASGSSPPSAKALRKWRKSVGPAFEFVVVLGANIGKLTPSEAFETELAQGLEAARLLESRCLLLQTPNEVTPSAVSKKRIAALLGRIPRDSVQVAWAPRGLWETDAAAVCAQEWKVTLVVDATREIVPPGPISYVRLPSIGETRSYGTPALTRVRDSIFASRDAYVIFETQGALKEAKLLRTIVQQGKKASSYTAMLREEEE
jgi:uncharacterized protein YecE (DUF72 family)